MSNIRDMIMPEADVGSDEDDESFDEENGDASERQRRRDDNIDDSSEEDDDDDDEEAAQEIAEGFIVDEDEEDEPENAGEERKRAKKRKRKQREIEERLDEEDLDLIGELPDNDQVQQPEKSKFKRLKRGHREDNARGSGRLDDIFSDDDDEVDSRSYARSSHRAQADEFDDFIEEDYPEDEDELLRQREDLEVARPRDRGLMGSMVDPTGLDKDALEDMQAIFGNGEEYDWALDLEEAEAERDREQPNLALKDVFEPSQLKEKLLTDEDNEIRFTDEPERFQLARKPFKHLQITPEQFKEESRWIAKLIWPSKEMVLAGDLKLQFEKAVLKVLEYFVVEELEVPYVFQHRKDYLIYARKIRNPDHRNDPDAPEFTVSAEKVLTQDDLWKILDLDIKFRSFIDKRNAVEKTHQSLREAAGVEDEIVGELLPAAETIEDLQELQDYLNFQYAARLRDIASTRRTDRETKRPLARAAGFDRIRTSKIYKLVLAYGIKPDQLALNAHMNDKKFMPDDDDKFPIDLADSLTDVTFPTGDLVLSEARQMYAEELFMSPRMRKHFKRAFYAKGGGVISCFRTEKGLRKLDDCHPYYEVKYLRDLSLTDLAQRPELFLKMMKAEEDGLVEIKIQLSHERQFRRELHSHFTSDNYSESADAWNEERKRVLDVAFPKLAKVVTKGVKDALRTVCQDEILKLCRAEFALRLDQAPYKPKGMVLGTSPRVLALTNGGKDPTRDPDSIHWVWVEENGRPVESGTFGIFARDESERDAFVEVVERRRPDVIAVSGWCADTHKLVRELESLVRERGLKGAEFDDAETGEYRSELLEVVIVQDEVARLFKDSKRAQEERLLRKPEALYCLALARYLQNPMKEYAALGKDVSSLLFHPCQRLLPPDKLLKLLETCLVDVVNLCGVEINEVMTDTLTANLLPYISGLGPRKAQSVLKAINANGGTVSSREDLVGDPDNKKVPVVGPRVWNNCASFLYVEYDPANPTSEPLDNTRVHPEDYELGRKMAADALELDEEDVKAETDANGPGAIVRKLFREEEQDKVNELILEEYAEQLERNYSQRKRATLETIRAELLSPYEELRNSYRALSSDQIFTMLTGETTESLAEGMVISVNIRLVKDDFAIGRLDCGIEGRIESHEIADRGNFAIKEIIGVNQTVKAKILELNRKDFLAKLSLREELLKRQHRKSLDIRSSNWDFKQEKADQEIFQEKDKVTGRTQRVIKHPNFKPFSAVEAEQWLGSRPNGDVVIRPSSKGADHLAVTWKVADNVYQHIDVLEMGREAGSSVGRILRVGGKYSYADLDELIDSHIKSLARKVEEMMMHDKFKEGSATDLEKWLTAYSTANPRSSVYRFCLDMKHPGYFFLCFKASKEAKIGTWSVRVVPNGYEMMKNQYPDMRALCNGFKLRFTSEVNKVRR